MTTPTDTLDVEAIARELMEARVQSVRDLAGAGDARAAAEEAFAAADATYVRLYGAALKNGWSEAELSRMKLAKPGARVRKRSASRATAPSTSGDASADQPGGAQGDGAPDYS